MRKPTGENGVASGARYERAANAFSRVVLRRLTRRSRGARSASALPLVGGLVAEARLEARRKPFGKVARDMRRRAGKVGLAEAFPLGLREQRRRVAFAREQRRYGLDVEAAGLPQRAEDFRAGRGFAHDPGGGAFLSQSVIDEARDGGAVAGAGEAMRKTPVLHGVGGGTAAGADVGENFDGCGGARGGGHGIPRTREPGSQTLTGSAARSRCRARRRPGR